MIRINEKWPLTPWRGLCTRRSDGRSGRQCSWQPRSSSCHCIRRLSVLDTVVSIYENSAFEVKEAVERETYDFELGVGGTASVLGVALTLHLCFLSLFESNKKLNGSQVSVMIA
jgi:hypothetical protein